MKIYKIEINGKTFDIIQDTDGKFIRPEIEGGSSLKPANEPICVARKPLSEKTIADNVLRWGTGGINIDGCRVGTDEKIIGRIRGNSEVGDWGMKQGVNDYEQNEGGRFPANIIFDESAAELLDEQSGVSGSSSKIKKTTRVRKYEAGGGKFDITKEKRVDGIDNYGDKGGASRFFYVAKVSKKERNLGLDSFEEKMKGLPQEYDRNDPHKPRPTPTKNVHPTLKPINLMTYLCRLITPPGGIILDPFMGSGSTGISAMLEGFRFIGMEMDEDYFKIAEARINSFEEYRKLLKK